MGWQIAARIAWCGAVVCGLYLLWDVSQNGRYQLSSGAGGDVFMIDTRRGEVIQWYEHDYERKDVQRMRRVSLP